MVDRSVLNAREARAGRAFPSVLFDEAHNEAWSIRPEIAAQMNPNHPGDAGYTRAATALRDRGIQIDAHSSGLLTAASLADRDVVVLAHPSDGTWERVTGVGSPKLSADEIDTLEAFVREGGGLVVLTEELARAIGAKGAAPLAMIVVEPIFDDFGDGASVERDRWRAAGHCFNQH